MAPILEQYLPQYIFNMDETGLFYNAQTNSTLAMKGETYHGGKKYRQAMLFCCNTEGSEKLFVMGKFEKPHC
jgi:hypothetical protein